VPYLTPNAGLVTNPLLTAAGSHPVGVNAANDRFERCDLASPESWRDPPTVADHEYRRHSRIPRQADVTEQVAVSDRPTNNPITVAGSR